ncbi:hypothetical protein ANO11243_089880 [Dothideomycetidae sp. 11243]|nr:hypothetical protein ANO11243_089880 [fungal sp. No.11243]
MFNKESIQLAESQRSLGLFGSAISSSNSRWYTPQDEEDDLEPELDHLGLDAIGPKLGEDNHALGPGRAANDRLLETLMGKAAAKQHKASTAKPLHTAPKPLAPETKAKQNQAEADDDSDGSEGRAAMFKSKSSSKRGRGKEVDVPSKGDAPQAGSTNEGDDEGGKAGRGAKKRKAAGSSYLDEVLAQKGSRKRK